VRKKNRVLLQNEKILVWAEKPMETLAMQFNSLQANFTYFYGMKPTKEIPKQQLNLFR